MKLLLTIALAALAPSLGAASTFAIDSQNQEVYDLFDGRINEMTTSYQEAHGVQWNATKIEDIENIYNEYDEQIGYLVLFDEGYLAYSNELSVYDVSPSGNPSYYKTSYSRSTDKLVYKCGGFNGEPINSNQPSTYSLTGDNIYFSLKNYYLADGFKINSSMVQIPFFKDVYDSSSWGNYQGITFSYAAPNCGAIMSTMSLMYTLKVNGGVDLTPYQTSYYAFMKNLEFYTAFDYTGNGTSFIQSGILFAGIRQYLEDNFNGEYTFQTSQIVSTTVPATTLYYNLNSTQTAEYCMRVGHCQNPSWWIFYDYFDIVMADENNFYYDSYGVPTLWADNLLEPFYVVNQNYRESMFQFFENGVLLS